MRYRTRCCNEIIESSHRHDLKTCPCGATTVDGGDAYSRVLWDPEVSGPPDRMENDDDLVVTARELSAECHEDGLLTLRDFLGTIADEHESTLLRVAWLEIAYEKARRILHK